MNKTRTAARQLSLVKEDSAPSETIQFFDGLFPALEADPNAYTITVTHSVTGTQSPPSQPPTSLSQDYSITQTFTVEGPQFTLDASTVQSLYPPDGSSGVFDSVLPFVVLGEPTLPWERAITPGDDVPDSSNPTPWMALLVLQEGEVLLDSTINSPLSTQTVSDLLASDPDTLKPSIPTSGLSSDVLASSCSSITITADAFTALMPLIDDLPFLAHTRQIDVTGEDPLLLSVVLANRLALTGQSGIKLYAHLVSLQGYAAYLSSSTASGQSIPQNGAGTGPMNVALVSLANWTFVSQPAAGPTFEGLVTGLIASQAPATLALPLPGDTSNLPAQVVDRLTHGYVALSYATGTGEQSFAWYRGPLSAVMPQPLPIAAASASSSDALMIYLQDQGLFDLSYASAWQWGRVLALADGAFATQVAQYRQSASAAVSLMAQRSLQPHLQGLSPAELLSPNPTKRQFARRLADGMGRRWNAALTAARAVDTPAPRASSSKRPRLAETMRGLLQRQDVRDALADHLGARLDAVATSLVDLTFLGNVPFSQLVSDPRMLPPESIRFFYVDQAWIDALTAGALSLGVQTSHDVMVQGALRPILDAAVRRKRAARIRERSRGLALGDEAAPLSGVLIRSQLVSGWPTMVVSASQAGTALPIVRKARMASDVLLCIFQGVPDSLALAEPYQGLRFGVADNGVPLRDVTTSGAIGTQLGQTIPTSGGFSAFLSTYCRTTTGGVVTVSALASALQTAVQASHFGAGDFALQMVMAPELQTFPTT